MAQTPPSLLNRLREAPEDSEAWQRFDALYRPLLTGWLRRYAIQSHDANDLVQEILHAVLRELPNFKYNPARGKFRSWLRGIMVNRLREFWRKRKTGPRTGDSRFFDTVLGQLEDPRSDLSRLWDQEHDQHVAQQILTLIERDFSPSTWQAFRQLMAGQKPVDIAAELDISVNAVYLAKSSIIKRLREEMAELGD